MRKALEKELIEQRLYKLERELRLWRFAVLGLILACVTIAARSVSQERITAREITVSDGRNVEMRLQPDGILLYQAGKLRATVGSETDSAAIMLYDKSAKPGMIMQVTGGKPTIELIDTADKKEKKITP
jgi:hypothetical protein